MSSTLANRMPVSYTHLCRVPQLQFSRSPQDSLLTHVCPFSVRADKELIARSFSWKLASATSVLIVMFHTRHAFGFQHPDLPGCPLPRLHQLFQQLDRLACSVTPLPLHQVRESPPVVHRLRLSASPQVPTYPERTNLPLETLGIRCVGFSPTFRYSHRHSLFLPLHMSLRSCFLADRNAPLPLILVV